MDAPAIIERTPNILVVDDTPANLELLSRMLKERGYKARPLTDGALGIQAARNDPPDLILLDINMPDMSGFEVCQILKSDPHLKDIPVIFISALNETIDKVRAFTAGGVDYITKPFQLDEVHARVATHLHLRRLQTELEQYNQRLQDLVQAQVREITESQMATIFALAKLAESRDSATGLHLERVQILCKLLAIRLSRIPKYTPQIDANFVSNLYHVSPLHDVGKVAIPDAILLKPGALTVDEFEIMKAHTTLGRRTLEAVQGKYPHHAFITMAIQVAGCHHEHWDGQGYPSGLAGDEIPLAARIMAVVDVYDALRSERCYKSSMIHERACDIVRQASGTHLDPTIVDAFANLSSDFAAVREKMHD